jgi:hypothetical protein
MSAVARETPRATPSTPPELPFKPGEAPFTMLERVGLVIALAIAAALMWPLRDYVTDDTYIHLQYAKHLAQGQGLVFNPGERVYGCTSPLWVALIADGMAFGLDGLAVARGLGFAATLAAVGLFLQLARRTLRTPAVRVAATIAWAGHAWMLRWSMSGMETPLAVALILAGFVAFTEGRQWGARPVRTGALWALAALTRPEAALLLLLWGAFLLIDAENREGLRRLVAGALPPAIIYGGWLLFARFYFGTFWPQTLSAKSAAGTGLEAQLDNLWRQARIVGATDALPIAMLVLAAVLGGRRMFNGARPGAAAQRLVPWAWVTMLPLLYCARGVPVISRYLLPLLPIVQWLAWRASESWWLGPDASRTRRATVLAAVAAAAMLAWNLVVWRNTVVPQVRTFSPALNASLVRWGRWFDEHAPADASIGTPDIGAIGYFGRRSVVDFAGLVTPEMVRFLQREPQHEAIAAFRFAAFARPEFIVDRDSSEFSLLRRSPWAASLEPLGSATMPNLGIARPEPVVYSFYRVRWTSFDSLRALRAAAPPSGR